MQKQAGPSTQQIVQERTLPGLLLFNSHVKLLSLNPIAQQILRYSKKTVILQQIRLLLHNLNRLYIKPEPSVGSFFPTHLINPTFSSGRRTYGLQISRLNHSPFGRSGYVAVLLERINPSRLDLHKAHRFFKMSPRELEVISALKIGRTDKEIGSMLGISSETVRGYLKSIRSKLNVSTRTAIINKLQTL